MSTPISTNVTRICPEITNDKGCPLSARLHEEDGGSISLRWKGRGQPEETTFSLRELMDFAEGRTPVEESEEVEPTKKGKQSESRPLDQVFQDAITRVHTVPMEIKDRERLVSILKQMRLHHAWLADNSGKSWEAFVKSQDEKTLDKG